MHQKFVLKVGCYKMGEKNPRQFKKDYDFQADYQFDYDLEKETWYKSAMSAYADSVEEYQKEMYKMSRKTFSAYGQMRDRIAERERKLAKERELREKRYPWLKG